MTIRRVLITGFDLAGLMALPLLIWRDGRYLYVAAALGPLIAPYVVVQPILRYHYLAWTLLVFLACDGVIRVIKLARTVVFDRSRSALDETPRQTAD